jgi:hypothetical protein
MSAEIIDFPGSQSGGLGGFSDVTDRLDLIQWLFDVTCAIDHEPGREQELLAAFAAVLPPARDEYGYTADDWPHAVAALVHALLVNRAGYSHVGDKS